MAKIARAELTHAFGSERYMYPGLAELDKKVWPYLPSRGFFVELGANDGYSQSNTYNLEKLRGWNGLLLEPLPSQFALCRQHRRRSVTINAACVSFGDEGVLLLHDDHLMSQAASLVANPRPHRLGKSQVVRTPAITLHSALQSINFPHVDFMSLDVEGAELSVLGGLRFPEDCPEVLLIETAQVDHVSRHLSPWMTLEDKLSVHDYVFVRRT